MSDDLVYDVSEHIATITLNRPERKNAFTLTMVDEWTDALRESGADDRVRAVVVTGAGDSFCSGVDLSALAEVEATPLGRKEMLTGRVHRVATALADLDKPVIACMRGAAVGAGMDMGLLCDMRVAGRSIKLIEATSRSASYPVTAVRGCSPDSSALPRRWSCCSPATRSGQTRPYGSGWSTRSMTTRSSSSGPTTSPGASPPLPRSRSR